MEQFEIPGLSLAYVGFVVLVISRVWTWIAI